VQVHIIEARELKAENLDGTSDPVVYVECFGQKQNTICVKSVSACSVTCLQVHCSCDQYLFPLLLRKRLLCVLFTKIRTHLPLIISTQVTSCVYDELFIFNMKDLDKETFADGLLRIACYDANSIPFAGECLCCLV